MDIVAITTRHGQEVAQHVEDQLFGAVDHKDKVIRVRSRLRDAQWVQAEPVGLENAREDRSFEELLVTDCIWDWGVAWREQAEGFERIAIALVGVGHALTCKIAENASGHWNAFCRAADRSTERV
ncbi:hypothetical protein ACFQ0M_28340 [Kitasatospora aburaviensis]